MEVERSVTADLCDEMSKELSLDLCSAEGTENSNETLFDPHYPIDSLNRMDNSQTLQTQEAGVRKKRRPVRPIKSYTLRGTCRKTNNVDTICKLLCKPISVSVTKLSAPELHKWTNSELSDVRPQDPLIQKKARKIKKTKFKEGIARNVESKEVEKVKKVKKVKDVKKVNSERNVEVQELSVPKRRKYITKKMIKRELLKSIRLPYIKLSRIDEVINKIAQTFAKVSPRKEIERNVQTECSEKSEVELSSPVAEPQELLPLSTNESNNECTENDASQSITAKSDANAIPQLNNGTVDETKSSDDETVQTNRRRYFKRRRVIYDSSDDSDDSIPNNDAEKPISQERKRLRLNSLEKVTDTCVSNDKRSVIEAKCIDGNETLRIKFPEKLDVAAELCDALNSSNLNVEINVDASQQSSCSSEDRSLKPGHSCDVHDNVEEDNSAIRVLSELSSTCTMKDNTPVTLEDDNLLTIEDANPISVKDNNMTVEDDNPMTVEDVNPISIKDNMTVEDDNPITLEDANPISVKDNNMTVEDANPISVKDNNMTVEDDNPMTIQETIVESMDIEEPMQNTAMLDKEDLIGKSKLFKELRVLLIRFDSIRNFIGNKYSAREIEQLTEAYMKLLMNLNFPNAVQSSSFNYTGPRIQENSENATDKMASNSAFSEDFNVPSGKSRKSNAAKTTQETLYLNTSRISNITASSEQIQNIQRSSDSSRTTFTNSSKREKLREKQNLAVRKVCHNLMERFADSSEGRCQNNVIRNSVKKSVVSPPIIEPTLQPSRQQVGSESSEFSTAAKESRATEMSSLEEKISKPESSKAATVEDSGAETSEKSETSIHRVNNLKSHPSKQSEILVPSGNRVHVIRSHKSAQNIPCPRLSSRKSTVTGYSSTVSPTKHKKPMDKKDIKDIAYKCIVCDLCFEDYSDLQQHLVIHTHKHNNTSSSPSKSSIPSSEALHRTTPRTSESETLESTELPERNHSEHITTESTVAVVGDNSNKEKKKNGTSPRWLSSKPRKKRRVVKTAFARDPNECTICSQVFLTQADLAAHIYLHTEKELQEAFKLAKQKLKKVDIGAEETESKESERKEKIVDDLNNMVDSGTPEVDKCPKILCVKRGSFLQQKPDGTLVPHDSKTSAVESITLSKKDPKSAESKTQTKLEKEKMNKVDNAKKGFTICDCHNKPGTTENCLRIEIVYLCHTCRVLFRSMECLETHYRLPEHVSCNENRLNRSPNIFCATCGMVFSSVQDVRHHLEIHARFKQTCTMEFRCNVCKVIFIGIGSQFYIHWSRHAKDPYWIASEQTFPKSSVIIPKSRSVEGYLHVAEYICRSCKFIFVTDSDLQKHVSTCKSSSSDTGTTVSENSTVTAEKRLSVKIICSSCNDVFTEKTKFYKHVMDKHQFYGEPKFVCISLTNTRKAFVCSICMDITENFDEFEDHWLLHSTQDVLFACTCGKVYRNNFNSFLEHTKEHKSETNDDVLSCTVSYQDSKTICKYCNIGFQSVKTYYEHAVIHMLNYDELRSEQSKVQNQECSASKSDRTVGLAKSTDLNSEKQPEQSSRIVARTTEGLNDERSKTSNAETKSDRAVRLSKSTNLNVEKEPEGSSPMVAQTIERLNNERSGISTTGTESDLAVGLAKFTDLNGRKQPEEYVKMLTPTTERLNSECSRASSTENDTEKLIRILEGSDDSEHELVIDLAKQPGECDETLSKEVEALRHTSKRVLTAGTWTPPSKDTGVYVVNVDNVSLQGTDHIKFDQNITITEASQHATETAIVPVLPQNICTAAPTSSGITTLDQESFTNVSAVSRTGIADREISEQPTTKLAENVQNNEVHDTVLNTNEEQLSALKDLVPPASPKPRRGFLRVKSLAELTGSVQLCYACGCSIQGSNNLEKHHECHKASETNDEECTILGRILTTQRSSNRVPEGNNAERQPLLRKDVSVPPMNPKTSSTPSPAPERQRILPRRHVVQSGTEVVNNDQAQQIQASINRNNHPPPSTERVTSAYHKNLPACNIARTTSAVPRSSIQRSENAPVRIMAKPANVQDVQVACVKPCATNKNGDISSCGNVVNTNADTYKYQCKFCNYRSRNMTEFLMHELPGTRVTCTRQYTQHHNVDNQTQDSVNNVQTLTTVNVPSNANCAQRQPTTMNQQPAIKYAPPSGYYQYSYPASNSSSNSNQMFQQNQQIIANQPLTGNASSAIYYKNPNTSAGGMSIVINQTAPALQNISTIGILQQPAQQQIHQVPVYTEPMAINLVDFSESRDVYQMANDPYNVPNGDTNVATYQVRLRAPDFICLYCPKTVSFVSNEMLQMHMNSDHNFICNNCNLRFYDFNDLNIHKIKHDLMQESCKN